jgi:serine/threonine protein kinase
MRGATSQGPRRDPADRRGGPIVLQALEGLEYSHDAEIPYAHLAGGGLGRGRGLVHRDLKPANLFLGGPDGARVTRSATSGLAKASTWPA